MNLIYIFFRDFILFIPFSFLKFFYKIFIFLDKYKVIIILTTTTITIGLGFYIYSVICNFPTSKTINDILNLFIDPLVYPENIDNSTKNWLDWISISAKSTLFFTIIIFVIKSQLASMQHWISVKKGKHILVIGLDKNSRFFINSEIDKRNRRLEIPNRYDNIFGYIEEIILINIKRLNRIINNIVVIEPNEKNPYISVYKNRAISVISKEIDTIIDKIRIDSARYIFVSTGNDRDNIYIALKIIEKAKADPSKKLLVHIENRTLRSLYNDGSLLDGKAIKDINQNEKKIKLDIQPFSYYKESARMFFRKHDIDGDNRDIITSDKPFEIAIIGKSLLAIEMIAEIIKIAHLPNNNILTINYIDKDIKKLKEWVEYEFNYINDLDYIKIKYIPLDHYNISFYYHEIWHRHNLKHIIFCFKESITNISTAIKLKRIAYHEQLDNLKRKIYVATYNDIKLSKELRKNNQNQDDIFVFATANEVCDRDNLIDTDIEKLAKLINYSYHLKQGYDKLAIDTEKEIIAVHNKEISINDKISSISQALHIKIKLKALNLRYQKNPNKSIDELIQINNKIFDKVLHKERELLKLTDNDVKNFNKKQPHFFPTTYKTMFEKLLRAEHNRWITSQLMMYNRYDPQAKKMKREERKLKKIHYLIKPFEEFEEDEKGKIIYDIYSILYIPEYIASLGCEIIEF